MSRRLGFLILLAVVPVAAHAQLKVHLDFGAPGSRDIWIGSDLPKALPSNPAHTDSASYDFIAPGFGATDKMFVWDHTAGNIAVKPMSDASKGWTIKPEDYKYIGQVIVRVEHKGLPVAAAGVTLKDKVREQTQQLDPAAKGELPFFGVTPGEIKVSVTYRANGKTAEPQKMGFDVPLKHDKADPVYVVSIADDVETVGTDQSKGQTSATTTPAAGSQAASSDAGSKETERANPLGTFVVILIALGVAVTVGYFVMQYMKNNSKLVEEKLEKLGVQVPKPQDDQALTAPVIPMPKAPEPPQKIVLDDAAPDPIGVVATSTAVTQPRLVTESGDEFPIPEGETSVGREVGLGLSLVGESTVSRTHAVVTRSGGTVSVKDLGSTNGTFVNGLKVTDETPLRPGDNVQFGQVRYRFEG